MKDGPIVNDAPILLCMGTRPEIIKMAPVYHALKEASLAQVIVHTGQHDSMAWPLYDFFEMRPDHVIHLERKSEGLAHLGALLLEHLDAIYAAVKPAAVLVQGDTSSALMGALAAFYRQIPVGHVEAGLRTHTPYDPFPEEMNRTLIGRLAHWHFAPTPQALKNLNAEGIAGAGLSMVGNTVIDAARAGVSWLRSDTRRGSVLPATLNRLRNLPAGQRLLLVTAHRRENWGAGIASIAAAVRQLLLREPTLEAVWPVHANPAVAAVVHAALGDMPGHAAARLHLCEPLDYPALLWLLDACWLVLTDSGGIQEEASALSKPVLVLRDSTERAELIVVGGGLLVGTSRDTIVAQTLKLMAEPHCYEAMRQAPNPFGDGRSGASIRDLLMRAMTRAREPDARPPEKDRRDATGAVKVSS